MGEERELVKETEGGGGGGGVNGGGGRGGGRGGDGGRGAGGVDDGVGGRGDGVGGRRWFFLVGGFSKYCICKDILVKLIDKNNFFGLK